jgi:hypothetical protein
MAHHTYPGGDGCPQQAPVYPDPDAWETSPDRSLWTYNPTAEEAAKQARYVLWLDGKIADWR